MDLTRKLEFMSTAHRPIDLAGSLLPEPVLQDLPALCERHGIARLELFGSAASGQFREGKSDYDFLYELDPAHPGLQADRLLAFAEALETLLGAKVDLVNPRYIRNRYFQAEVERTRVPIHA
jgi:predicted nucleotidyltransferase